MTETSARLNRYAKAVRMVDEGTARPLVVEAVGLLRKGYAPQEIGRTLGVARSTAYQLLCDPDRSEVKARRLQLYGERTCELCGKALGEQAGPPEGPGRCVRCANEGQAKWSEGALIEAGHEYFRRYGRPPGAMDWNPSMALNTAHPERRAEVLARWHEYDWPVTTVVQYHFKSWNAFMKAAGFDSLGSGERRDPERWRRNRQSGGGRMALTADDVIKREIDRFEERVAQYREKLTESEQELAVLRAAQEAMVATRSNGKPESVRANQA